MHFSVTQRRVWFVGGLVFYLRNLYLFAHSGVQHILWCVFVCLRLVSCVPYMYVASFSLLSNFDCPNR